MTNEVFLIPETLSECLEFVHQTQWTGRLDINTPREEQQKWSIYLLTGQLIWCSGGAHQQRRWRRLLYQYCPHISSSEANPPDACENYYQLARWVEQGLLMPKQAKLLIQNNFDEVLFDILRQESQEKLTFSPNNENALTSSLFPISAEQLLKRSKDNWKYWYEAGLEHISPNYVPVISHFQRQQLEKQVNLKLDRELVRVIDGEKSLRDVALVLSQPLLAVSIQIKVYRRWGFVELLKKPDLSLSKPFPPLSSTSFTSLENSPLDNSPIAQKTLPSKRSFSFSFKWLLPMLLFTLVAGGGGFAWRNQLGRYLSATQESSPLTSELKNKSIALQPQAEKVQLTLLGDTFSGYSTFRNTAFQTALQASGIKLRYQDEFDQAKRADELNRGDADILVTSLDQFLLQQPKGKIVGLIDRTAGADALVLNTNKYKQLKSLQDLSQLSQQASSQGKKPGIAFAGDTPSEYLTLLLTTKFQGFNLTNFQVHRVRDASVAWKLMQDPQQDVAVAVLWEPFVSQARKKGYSVALSSFDVPNAIIDVIVASDRLLQEHPEQVSALLETYYRRLDANLMNNSELLKQIGDDSKLSSSDAANVLQGIKFFSASEAQQWLRSSTLEKTIGYTAAVLTLTGKLDRPLPNLKQLYTSQFIEKAARNTQTLLDQVRATDPVLADNLLGKNHTTSNQITAPEQINSAKDIGELNIKREIKFQTSNASLTSSGERVLNQLAQEIEQFNPKTVAVHIIGHTSSAGEVGFNQKLSQLRAQAVADYLHERGGLKHQIIAEGKGSSQPLPGIDPTNRRNQRTEIRLERKSITW